MNHFYFACPMLIAVAILTGCADMRPVPVGSIGAAGGGTTTGALSITRIELVFDNGRAQATIPRNGRLSAHASIQFNGNGLLRAAWLVDGNPIEIVNRNVVFGETVILDTSPITLMPTFADGAHEVTLRIDQPQTALRMPQIQYFVSGDAMPVRPGVTHE